MRLNGFHHGSRISRVRTDRANAICSGEKTSSATRDATGIEAPYRHGAQHQKNMEGFHRAGETRRSKKPAFAGFFDVTDF